MVQERARVGRGCKARRHDINLTTIDAILKGLNLGYRSCGRGPPCIVCRLDSRNTRQDERDSLAKRTPEDRPAFTNDIFLLQVTSAQDQQTSTADLSHFVAAVGFIVDVDATATAALASPPQLHTNPSQSSRVTSRQRLHHGIQ